MEAYFCEFDLGSNKYAREVRIEVNLREIEYRSGDYCKQLTLAHRARLYTIA